MASVLKYADLRAQTSSAFDKLGTFLADLCEATEAHHDSSDRPNLDTNLGSFYETFTALKARHADQNLTVAVLALTKSGKSTLLNALIGASCLPANNVPETARITRITHTLGQAELVDNTSEPSKTITGEADIKAYLQYLNSEVRMRDHQQSDETYLDLKIPIAALKAYNDEAVAHDVTVRLLDTPGPNEAGEVALKAQVERLLDSVDAVIYLLDYTKLKTADEAEVLQRLKEINPQLMARLSQRLFFVVNKADMIEMSEGLDAEATKQYVANLITHQMQDESFQLKPDQVLLVSAQQALLSRLVLQGKLDKDVAMRFGRLAFGSKAGKFTSQEHRAAAEEMLTECGLAELEETVLAFLYAHSGSLKLLALLDDLVRMLQQIKNVAAASNAALQHDVAFLQKETQELQTKLEESLQSFDTVQQDAQAVEGEVVDEVQQRMQRLKEKLFQDVTNALQPSRQHPPGRWQEAWYRAGRFLNRRPGHSQAQELELQNKLYELHAAISSSLEAEVRDFWQDVEAATNERQHAMFQCINRRLESLSRQIEATVGEALDLRLEPVTIAMDPPAAQDFHESLQDLFAQGIRQRSVTRSRRRQQAYTVWEPRFLNGLCRTGQYFVGRPASRHVTEQYEHPVYELQPQHIKEYFIALVDGTIEASVKYVREYVHAYLSDMLEEARGQIHSYGQSFSTTIQAALSTRQQGEEASSAALRVTSARLASTNSLLREVTTIQRCADQLCPGQHPISDVMSDFSLDEPESSSHAVHAQLSSNHTESSHGASAVAGASSKGEEVRATGDASAESATEKGRNPSATGSAPVEPVVCKGVQANVHGPPQGCAVSASAGASAQYKPKDYSKFDMMTDSDSESEHAYMPANQAGAVAAAAAAAAAPLGSDKPAEANEESPLPGIMSDLQQAMTDSISSSGSGHEAAEGMLLDEQTELELALFMSLQGHEHVQAQAPVVAESESETESAESVPKSLTESLGSESESEAESAESESGSIEAAPGAESVAMAAAAKAHSAASAAAFQAESAATAAAAQAESAATAATAHAESAATAATAHAESAATAAAAHATAAANRVAAHVEAAARSVDAALNHQAASVRGTVLSFADHLDGWWPRRPRPQQGGPQRRGPRPAGAQQRGPQVGVQAPRSTASTSDGQASVAHSGPAALSTHASGLLCQEDEAILAEAVEQMQSPAQEIDPRASTAHSVSSDDSSFDLTEAPAAAPALPIDQFAALSLLDFNTVVPSFEDVDSSQDPDDSPFDVHSEDQEGAPSSHINIGHDVAMAIAGQVVPVIPWDATEADQDLCHNAPRVQSSHLTDPVGSQALMQEQGLTNANTDLSFTSLSDSNQQHTQWGLQDADAASDAPVSYPQVDASSFSASMRSESPVRYPQLHRPSYHHPTAGSTPETHQPASPRIDRGELPSPRTQMHLTALGSGAFSFQSSTSVDEAQQVGEQEAGDVPSAVGSGRATPDSLTGGSAAWLLEADEPPEAAASIHVHQEHEEVGRLAALSGHAETSHDSDEWELVSSDLDEQLE